MTRIQQILTALCVFIALASAYSAPTFCKCTCFTNSTIIPLGPQRPSDGGSSNTAPPPANQRDTAAGISSSPASVLTSRASSSSCNQCNRAFCLDYNLPICKGAEEKDVVAMCFQRDSRKDQIIVWCFLLATGSLLGWTAVQRVLKLKDEGAENNNRAPLLGGAVGGNGGGNVFERLAASVGIVGRDNRGGISGSRSPLSSPSAAIPRNQYAPLDGNGRD
ncbi:hypothetical protein SEUCBS139899_003047 [Sporothrix eucalyptigena]|uniref:Integral membrane protein n=1 Tax=Sporothrix eucalyptigena TaxID=1812306 RepID=A0ABP0CNH6_9PEZI